MAGTIIFPYTTANIWSAKSHRSIGEFLGVNSPILRPILEGPRGQNCDTKTRIQTTPSFGDFIRRRRLPHRPYTSRAHPQDDVRAGNSLKLLISINKLIHPSSIIHHASCIMHHSSLHHNHHHQQFVLLLVPQYPE